jgi:hypothetical protein
MCDEAWNITNWAVSVFGASLSGTFNPATKPDPFTLENSCHVRSAVACGYDDPALVVDTLITSGWTAEELPVFATVCACNSCNYEEGQLGKMWSISGASSIRVGGWHHVQRYVTVTVFNCGDNQIKFAIGATYSVTRMARSIQRYAGRYKEYSIDCVTNTATPLGDFVYGEGQDESSYIIDDALELPCAWPQLNTSGTCPQESNPTDPSCDSEGLGSVIDLNITRLICSDGVCVESITTRGYSDGFSPLTGCDCNNGPCTFSPVLPSWSFGLNADRKQYVVEWESDCISCDEIASLPDTITLNRVSASISLPATGDVTAFMYSSLSGGFCGTFPAVSVVIPYSLTLSLS